MVLERMGRKSTENLLKGIGEAAIDFGASGVRTGDSAVSEHVARVLCEHFRNLDALQGPHWTNQWQSMAWENRWRGAFTTTRMSIANHDQVDGRRVPSSVPFKILEDAGTAPTWRKSLCLYGEDECHDPG